MKTLLSLITIFSLSLLNAQKKPIGFSVKFQDGLSYSQQNELLKNLDGIQELDQEHVLKGFDVSFVLLNEDNQNHHALDIQLELNELETVQFSSLLFESEQHAFAAGLNELFIQPKNQWSKEEAKSFAALFNFKNVSEYQGMPNTWKLSFDKNLNVNYRSLIAEMKASDNYKFVCQNMIYSVRATTNDPYLGNQWALENDGSAAQYNGTVGADMQVVDAWAMNTGEDYIKVAVLDSGTDTNHVDLVGNLITGFDGTGGSSKGYPNETYSNDGHGTCTAGIIAAKGDNAEGIAGIAYDCKVIPVKIFYYINLGGIIPFTTSSAGTDGIIWAIDTAHADILSNSWGLLDADIANLGIDTTLSNAVISQKIVSGRYGKGTPMLFSSGNEGDAYSIWPASHPKTISVGASTMCDELKTPTDCSPEGWWGSNHGNNLDVTAPGVKVLATDMTGALGYNGFTDNDYSEFNGTSAACPNAAGVLALILSEDSTLNYLEAREILSRTAEQVGGYDYDQSMDYGWWSDEMGYGRVNALKALQYMNSTASIEEHADNKIYYENGLTYFQSNFQNEVMICDMKGAVIAKVESNNNLILLNQYIAKAGMYILKSTSPNGDVLVNKFVIQ